VWQRLCKKSTLICMWSSLIILVLYLYDLKTMKHLPLSKIVLKLKGLQIPYSLKINRSPPIDELGEFFLLSFAFFQCFNLACSWWQKTWCASCNERNIIPICPMEKLMLIYKVPQFYNEDDLLVKKVYFLGMKHFDKVTVHIWS
jgi:hypothetical protein